MKINLVALQLHMQRDDYMSFAAFEKRMRQALQLAEKHMQDHPTLVVLPENLGFYLGSMPFHTNAARSVVTFREYVQRIGRSGHQDARYHLFAEHALETWDFYSGLFGDLARTSGAYIAAGSLVFPSLDTSPHRDRPGAFSRNQDTTYNTCPVFNPAGRCIGRRAKHYLPGVEGMFVTAAPWSDFVPVKTALGNLGVTICFDGFHDAPIEQLDSLGAQILLQPVFFGSPEIRFDGSGSVVPAYEDFIRGLQGRENIRFGVSSAFVGEVFPEHRAEGLSFVAANRALPSDKWQNAILARTDKPFDDAVVAAVVELPEVS